MSIATASTTTQARTTAEARTEARTAAEARTTAEAVEQLVREHLPQVGHIVREVLARVPGHVHRDDLMSAGMTALLFAARAFDADRGVPFRRFAAARIRGAVIDELRGMDWASRSVRSRARRAERARQELTASLGRTPSVAELADHLGTSVHDLESVEESVQRAMVLSLQGFAPGDADHLVSERVPGPEDVLLHRERIGYLHDAVEALPERLRVVIHSYFLQDRTMGSIAADLGVTESRVSQLRGEALSLLRDGMNAQLDPQLVRRPAREGCVARRRAAYSHKVASCGSLRSRLAATTTSGLPVALAA